MKKLVVFALSIVVLAGCSEKLPVCNVTGEIKGLTGASEVYVLKQVSEFVRDTVLSSGMTDGKFSISIPAAEFGYIYELGFKDERSRVPFFAENGTVIVEGDKKNIYFSKVSGTYENDRLRLSTDNNIKLAQMRDELLGNSDKDAMKAAMKEVDEKMGAFRDSIINSNNNSIFSLYLVKQRLALLNHTQIDEKLAFFSEKMKTHPYYIEMAERADVLRKIAEGAVAPDFTAMTPDGESISLSSFKGKYVLLDFWASWCVPCRAENQHTKKLHDDFAKKGLNILSFSLDSEKDKWMEAIGVDGLVWNNASDLVGGKLSPIAKLYGIDGIPAIWLIGPDGVIIADNVRGEKLYKLCEEIFNK